MNFNFIIVFIVLVVIMFGGTQFMKQRILKRLLKDLREGRFEDYFKTLDTITCKYFYPPFNREYMRMNAYVMQSNQAKVEEQFNLLLNMRMSKKQEIDIVVKAFYYYIDEENKTKTRELLDRMGKIGDDAIAKECQIIYDIFILKEVKYIDTMLEQLANPEVTGVNRGMFHYMLAVQYANNKNAKEEMLHLEKALVDLKGTPYEIRINYLLSGQK